MYAKLVTVVIIAVEVVVAFVTDVTLDKGVS